MKFHYAELGVKKIFSSRIIALFSAVALLIAGFFGIITLLLAKASGDQAAMAGVFGVLMLAFMLAGSVMMVVSFIFNIIGLTRAAKDERTFTIALFAIAANILFVGFGGIFSTANNAFMASLMNAFSTVAEMVAFLYTIQGIRKLAVRIGDTEMDNKGVNLFKIMLVVIVFEFIGNLIVLIFGGQTASVIAAIVYLAAVVLTIVEYVLFLTYLSKAKKMLANAKE
jgi:hypothetical protein